MLYDLKDADEFAAFRVANPKRDVAWVAERSEPGLGVGLKAVDRLVEVLGESELYICILADARHGEKEHGSPIEIADWVSATSYFEIELYASAMQGKRPHLFILDGFCPGPRLAFLLRLLSIAIPEWRGRKPMPAKAILDEVRRLITRHIHQQEPPSRPLRQRLVREYYIARAEKAPPGSEADNVLFLGGQIESSSRKLPQKDLVESLLLDFESVPEMQRKLSRMWLAARELMSASYFPKDVQRDSRLSDFLPLWDKVLGFWTSAAKWSGWHGHIYAGTVAPLNSQTIVRAQLRDTNPPNGPLSSAYYSIANLMPLGIRRLQCLCRASEYIKQAIRISGGRNAGELAIRGSIRLRLGCIPGAISDFRSMLRIRENAGESEEQLGDALAHLGLAYLCCGRWLTARDYLEHAVRALSKNPSDPGIARAKIKLARAYKLTGRFSDSKRIYEEAQNDAIRLGALDQVNR